MQSDNKTMLCPNEETIYDIKGFKRHKSLSSIIYLKDFVFISINHHEWKKQKITRNKTYKKLSLRTNSQAFVFLEVRKVSF